MRARFSYSTTLLACALSLVVIVIFVPLSLAQDGSDTLSTQPPGGDWQETDRYIIFQSKDLTVWLIWYQLNVRMASEVRMRDLGLIDTLKYLEDIEGKDGMSAAIMGMGRLTDVQLYGADHICRAYNGLLNASGTFEDVVLNLNPPIRNHLFTLVGELGAKARIGDGLSNAIDRGLSDKNPQGRIGLIGQLRAAEQFARQFAQIADVPADKITVDFEVPKLTENGFREVDLRFRGGGRSMNVEVKTNVGNQPSIDLEQMRKDVLNHLNNRFADIVYMYPSGQTAKLDRVRDGLLKAFDGVVADAAAGKITDPFLAANTTPAQARASLEARLPTMVTTFALPDLLSEKRN